MSRKFLADYIDEDEVITICLFASNEERWELMNKIDKSFRFQNPNNSTIYNRLMELQIFQEGVSLTKLYERLKEFGELEMVGGAAKLSKLTENAPLLSKLEVVLKNIEE